MLAQCVGFLYLQAGGCEFNFFFPLRRVIFFFHQDAYKCFPSIIFLNINAPVIIIRKPTLFLCSFHNDNKCFVGYFWKQNKKYARTPHALDIAEIYLIIISLCFTFAEPFDDIFLVKLCIGQRKYKQKSTNQGRKDWSTERTTKRVNSRSLT